MAREAILAERLLTPGDEWEPAAVVIEGERIVAAGPREGVDTAGAHAVKRTETLTAIPGFVDVHVHGAGGHDVMEASPDALGTICETLSRRGTAALLATTVTASRDATCRSLEGIARYIDSPANHVYSRAKIAGIHLEGPFISAARRGVHPPEYIEKPAVPLLEKFLAAAAGHVRLITLAPEIPGALELIGFARSKGLVVSLGHTDATYEQSKDAIRAGARHAAHVFNAMRPFVHRETGVLGAVLTELSVTAELIADGVHVDAAAIRVLLAAKGPAGIVLVSDGTAATGMPDGHYQLGGLEVEVCGGVCRNVDGRLAGSTLTLDRAIHHLTSLGVKMADAVAMATSIPARIAGLDSRLGTIAAGMEANVVLLSKNGAITSVMLRGEWVA
jgi:N-acetylglucosamine-6-phosphate deacetylase